MPKTGHGSTCAWGLESTYGTPVTPTDAMAFLSETIAQTPNFSRNSAIRPGNRLHTTSDVHRTNSNYGGNVKFPIWDRGLELWWRALMGGYSFSVGTPNEHDFFIGATEDRDSLTVVTNLGDSSASGLQKTSHGVVPVGGSISWSAESDAPAEVDFEVVAEDITYATGQAISQTNADAEPINWSDTQVTFNSLPCVQAVSLDFGMNVEGTFCLGQKVIDEPYARGMVEITGSIDFEFEDETEAEAANNGDVHQLTILGSSPVTAGFGLRIVANVYRTDGSTPTIEDDGVITQSMSIQGISTAKGDNDLSGITVTALNDLSSL